MSDEKEVFSFMADNENDPKVITIKIPIGRLTDNGFDGFCRLRGYMAAYADQLQGLFVDGQKKKALLGVITAQPELGIH